MRKWKEKEAQQENYDFVVQPLKLVAKKLLRDYKVEERENKIIVEKTLSIQFQ